MFNIDLQRHIESKHPETVKMEKNLLCDQCDYATNVKVNINMHKEFIHIYPDLYYVGGKVIK